jgi:hypothetical protein
MVFREMLGRACWRPIAVFERKHYPVSYGSAGKAPAWAWRTFYSVHLAPNAVGLAAPKAQAQRNEPKMHATGIFSKRLHLQDRPENYDSVSRVRD